MQVKPEYETIIQNYKKNIARYKRIFKVWKDHPPKNLDKDLAAAQAKAFESIDCLECGNCCRGLGPLVRPRDVPPLAKSMGMTPVKFEQQYLRLDEEGDMVFKTRPCPFIQDDNHCFVYHDRPSACSDYPHLQQRAQHTRTTEIAADAEICPAVARALESFLPSENPTERDKRRDQ